MWQAILGPWALNLTHGFSTVQTFCRFFSYLCLWKHVKYILLLYSCHHLASWTVCCIHTHTLEMLQHFSCCSMVQNINFLKKISIQSGSSHLSQLALMLLQHWCVQDEWLLLPWQRLKLHWTCFDSVLMLTGAAPVCAPSTHIPTPAIASLWISLFLIILILPKQYSFSVATIGHITSCPLNMCLRLQAAVHTF